MEETCPRFVWPPGYLVYRSEPFAQVVYFSHRNKYCDKCFGMPRARKTKVSVPSFPMIPCHRCKYVYYCSKKCKNKARDYHRKECAILKTFVEDAPYYCDVVLLVMRVILKMEGKKLADVTDGVGASLENIGSLISSCTWPDDKEVSPFLSSMRYYMEKYLGESNLPENLDKIIITVERHRFDVQRIGTAFYIGASTLNRVCVPTAAFYFEKSTLIVKVIELIPADDNSMLTISKFSFMDGHLVITSARALILGLCTCPECTDPENSLLYEIIDESTADLAFILSLSALDIAHTALESGRKELNEDEKFCIVQALQQQQISFGRCHFYRIRLLAAKTYFESDLIQKAYDLWLLWTCIVDVFGPNSDQLIFLMEQRFEVAEALGWPEEKECLAGWYKTLCDLLYRE